MGASGQEKSQYNLLNSQTQFATGLGEGNLSLSSSFFRDLLNNPTKAMASEISAGQKQVGQQAKSNAEFGTRSGGTTGATQAAEGAERGNIINLMGKEQSGAAEQLSSSGQNLLGMGMQGSEAGFGEAKTMQEQNSAKLNDIFKSAASVGGGIASGISKGVKNLDTTGGSTGWEQFENFFSGATSGGGGK